MKPLPSLKPIKKELKPLVQIASAIPSSLGEGWKSPGVVAKPKGCDACKYSAVGAGFCGDDSPVGKRMLILAAAPTKGEIFEQRAWAGPQGYIYSKWFLQEAGIPREEVQVGHVLRCRPPYRRTNTGIDSYPGGTDRRNAELTCRQFDESHSLRGSLEEGGVKTFAPDTFLLTFEPEKALEITAYKRIIQEDIKKAWRLVQRGRRVCVLMGEPAVALHAGELIAEGGVKLWRGHYFSGEWKFDTMTGIRPSFNAPRPAYRKRKK